MAQQVSVQVVYNHLPEIAMNMRSYAGRVTAESARAIANRAKSLAPEDHGDLKDSIEPRQVGPMHWEVVADIRYAGYVEYGTHHPEHGPAQPYMTPAAHQEEPAFDDKMRGIADR